MMVTVQPDDGSPDKGGGRIPDRRQEPSDVCLILEGSYPFVFGGVSSWTQSQIYGLDDLVFGVAAIRPGGPAPEWQYSRPHNLRDFHDIPLSLGRSGNWSPGRSQEAKLAALFCDLVSDGQPRIVTGLLEFLKCHRAGRDVAAMLDSPSGWAVLRRCYEQLTPQASFLQFYWAWRSFFGAVLRVLTAPLPEARVYHAAATGYAGLMAARATVETGRPAMLTEHGIYTNERRIDLMLATWLRDSILRDPDTSDETPLTGDVRDFWLAGFESLARISYTTSRYVISLSAAGRAEQLALGAAPERTQIIPNGIDMARFDGVARIPDGTQRIALVGRVVAIKDVFTFLRAVALLTEDRPKLEAWIVGPDSEEPAYAARCRDQAAQMGLGKVVRFTGTRAMEEVLSSIDLLVLTSTSESLPLVLLEAGAAGVPCIATDVGACREVILGQAGEYPPLGPGGSITPLVAPEDTAAAVARLLDDATLHRVCATALRARVARYYRREEVNAAYRGLYSSAGSDGRVTPWRE